MNVNGPILHLLGILSHKKQLFSTLVTLVKH